jgi:hypothetical protein
MASTVALAVFPPLPPGTPGRVVYVAGLVDEARAELVRRGYRPVELMTMPRGTWDENRAYLLAKAQAIEEQTVVADEEARKQLELEMRAYGLLQKQTTSIQVSVDCDAEDIRSMFGWGPSRHTLAHNSTAVVAAKLHEPAPAKVPREKKS